jgi:hypothetical protein
MATTLALSMRASMSASGVVSGANETAKALDKIAQHAEKTSNILGQMKGIAIGAIVAKGAMAAASGLYSAAQGAISYAAGVAEAVDRTSDLAQRLGMGVESLQALQMAAKLSGVEDATGALQKLTVAIGNAAESGKTDAFTKLGLNFDELNAMSPEEQFKAVQQAIAGLATPAEKAAAAVAIFGKSGVELLPLMSQNVAEIEERMRKLGAIVGTDQVDAIGEMNDSLDMVKATFEGIVGNVVGNLAPFVSSMAEDFLSFVQSMNEANAGAGGIAGVLTEAVLDIADSLAGVFDNAVEYFMSFGVTLTDVAAVFETTGHVLTAVTESMRYSFNAFEVAVNALGIMLGDFLQGLGSYVSSDLEEFGKNLASQNREAFARNTEEGIDAAMNAGRAAKAAVFGGDAELDATDGPMRRGLKAVRDRMTPEAIAERESARKAAQAEAKAAREAAAAKAKEDKQAAEQKKKQEEAAKKAAAVDEKISAKEEEIGKIEAEKAAALSGQSNEALKANDIRSSEGMAQFIALATGREDPAIAENRKTNQKLEEIRKELAALQQEKVDILGAAA